MPDVRFEKAETVHIPDLIALDVRTATDAHRAGQIRTWVAEGTCTVAIRNRKIVGYAVMHYRFYERGFIEALYVHPAYRRQGIGEGAMRYLRSVCRTETLFTSTNLSNNPMQKLLAKLGYELDAVIHHLDPEDPELLYVHEGK